MSKIWRPLVIILCSILLIYSFQTPSNSKNIINTEVFSLEKSIEQKDDYKSKKQWKRALKELNRILKNSYFEDISIEQAFYEEGLQIIQKLNSKELEIARFHQMQADFLISIHQEDSAIIVLQKAQNQLTFSVSPDEKHLKTTIKASTLISLAVSYYYQGEHKKMLKNLQAAEKINQSNKLPLESQSDIYQLLGVYFYNYEKDYEKGVEYTLMALQVSQQMEDELYGIASLHNNLGVLYEKLQEFTQSTFHFEKTLALYDKLEEENTEKIDVLHNYASALRNLEEFKKSKKLLFRAMKYNQNHYDLNFKNRYSILLQKELAKVYTKLNELDSATFYINEALKYAYQYDDKMLLQSVFLDKSYLFFKEKNYDTAIEYIKKGLALSKKIHSNIISKIETYNLLGQIYIEKKQSEEAIKAFDIALQTNERNNKEIYNASTWLESLSYKADALKQMNTSQSTQTAFELYQEAIDYAENMRQNFTFEASKSILNARTSELYTNTIQIAHQLYEATQDEKYIGIAFSIAEKQKGIVLLESFIDKKGKASYGVPNDLIRRESNFKNKIAYYRQQMIEFEDDASKLSNFKGYFNDYNLKLAQLKDTLKTFYSDYFEVEYQAAIANITQVQQEILRPNQAFIEYVATKDSAFYVLAIEENEQHFIKLSYQNIEKATLQKFKKSLNHPNLNRKNVQKSFNQLNSSAASTYNYLFEPILKELSSDVNSFIIVRAGELSTIPFEALLSQKSVSSTIDFVNLPYLIYDYQFHYGYSGSLLLKNIEQQKQLKSNNECLAFAPIYEPTEGITRSIAMTNRDNITPLAGTAEEIKAIQKHFGGQFDATNQASEEKFKANAKDYGILHLAMHGQPDIDEPAYAHLIFANSSFTSEDDGLLYQYEIANLNTNAQLAVLSACETGVGKDIEGEGVMSLGRAFMYAGVPSVVMSLWKMNDISTSKIMPFFYKNLANNTPKDEALHQAKLTYLNQTAPERAHPFYWAGLIAIGDTAPIQNGDSENWYWWLMAFIVLVGLGGYSFFRTCLE